MEILRDKMNREGEGREEEGPTEKEREGVYCAIWKAM